MAADNADPSSEYVAAPPNPEQTGWLEQCREIFPQLCFAAGQTPDSIQEFTLPELLDVLVRWWHTTAEDERPDEDTMSCVLGVALGDMFTEGLPLEWMWVKDAFGESLALWSADPLVVVAPIDSIAKRISENPEGFVVEYAEYIWPQLQDMLGVRDADSDDDSDEDEFDEADEAEFDDEDFNPDPDTDQDPDQEKESF